MRPGDNLDIERAQKKPAVNHGSYFDVANRNILTSAQCI